MAVLPGSSSVARYDADRSVGLCSDHARALRGKVGSESTQAVPQLQSRSCSGIRFCHAPDVVGVLMRPPPPAAQSRSGWLGLIVRLVARREQSDILTEPGGQGVATVTWSRSPAIPLDTSRVLTQWKRSQTR